jgi:glycosyltransferase involved in cell wall biosynthesis
MQINNPIKSSRQKAKVVRVVTASMLVPWHLENTLRRMTVDFEVCVVGQGVSYYRDQYPDVIWVDVDLNREIMVLSDFLALLSLCRFFLSYKPDIVHSIMPKAGLLTALAGFICRVPIRIHTFTGQVWATKKGVARFFLITIDKLINTLNTVCLTDSPSQSLFLQQHHITRSGRPLPVLSKGSLSGVDVGRFNVSSMTKAAERLRLDLGLSRQNFVFAFVARKTRDKGAFDIITAFSRVVKRHPACNLLFVGPDDSQGELEQLMATNPDFFTNIINIGKVDNHELFLAISNVLCLPSYREGFGSIVIDAAALSVPTIGSNIVGLVDSIEDGKTGILFPAGDIDRLVSAMLSSIENPKQVKAMGISAKQRVNNYFSADILYKALHDFYLELLLKFRSS